MALSTASPGEFVSVRNPFNLQTQQKRLRHLRSISVRNLHSGGQWGEHISRLQCYFTLHADVHTQAFYESEKITGSTNPSWQSFDVSRFEDKIDLAAKFFVFRVWVGHQDNFRLLIVMEIHLTGLHFLGDKLQQVLVKHNPNTVIFGMLDKEFVFVNKEQTRVKNMVKKVADLDLPCSLLPAVVKVEKGTVRNSYTTSSLSRIQTVLRAIKQMQTHARRYRRQIEDKLLASQENAQRYEEREELHMTVGLFRQDLLRRTTHMQHTQERLQALRDANTAKVETLKRDTKSSEDLKQILQEDKREYITKREHLVKENALLNLRRRQMLSELFNYIYPITEDGSKYFINGVRLPHAEEFHGQDEAMIAVGLGYSCHLTVKMSQILGLPLRHPMENRGSKSVIYDQVHSKLADKDREFPLYSKGKDKYHFNYGVFLLNKNISQLRFQLNVPTLDLRQTLKNQQTLFHKLGVRLEGDTSTTPTLTTPEGTVLSQISLNGSSVTPSQTPSSVAAANGDVTKQQGSSSGHHPSKLSDLSDSASGAGNPASRVKGEEDEERENFDETEDIFKPRNENDPFFKVNNSFMDGFNTLSIDGVKGGSSRNSPVVTGDVSGADDQEMNSHVSAVIQTASDGETLAPRSFKLVKQNRSAGEKGEVDDDGDENRDDGADDGMRTKAVMNNGQNGCDEKDAVDGKGDDCGDDGSRGAEDTNEITADDDSDDRWSKDTNDGDGDDTRQNRLDDTTDACQDEIQPSDLYNRRESEDSGSDDDAEAAQSGAAAYSERTSRDWHRRTPAHDFQSFSDLDIHSVQLTDIGVLLLIEEGEV
ncbi:UV radiation resistance-associated protein-like [Littorina saxatilis]|uniref:UV radiation resistance associated protein n=1 Tax=Littorina saxatilis TaxID=31220 RepID=A0AAN9AP71_9CAEN